MAVLVKNPHSIHAVLATRPEDVLELSLPSGHGASDDDVWVAISRLAREKGVRSAHGGAQTRVSRPTHGGGSRRGESREPREHRGDEGGRVGSGEARVREREGVSAEELFAGARERSSGMGLWLALDSLQDPHNVGAIFRAAAFFGVEGILMTIERSAPMSSAVYDVASGGVEYVPFCAQTNLQRGFEVAKEAGLWILGTSEHATDSVASVLRDRPWLLVLGNEEKGMRRLTEENCDVLCRIPPAGKVTSLNVSVAAGILISTLTGATGR